MNYSKYQIKFIIRTNKVIKVVKLVLMEACIYLVCLLNIDRVFYLSILDAFEINTKYTIIYV